MTGVAFTPDGRTLVAGGADRAVRSWDVADPARPVPGAVFTGAAAELQAVAVGPDGRLLRGRRRRRHHLPVECR